MKKETLSPFLQVLLAAILFGASAPFSKLLLGEMDSIPLAGLLYIGSGLAGLILYLFSRLDGSNRHRESRLERRDYPWLLAAIFAGGVAAPIILLLGLNATPASTASLLLNFESVATMIIALLFFGEAVGRRVWWAVGLITAAGILLSWNPGGWGVTLGALGIVAACFLWGLDNNLIRHISGKDPLMILAFKGLGAGTFSLLLALALGRPFPAVLSVLKALGLGAVCYGLSIFLFIHALRSLGAARTGALFGIAPFSGALLSIFLLRDLPGMLFWISLLVMAAGTWLMAGEEHGHGHVHEPLEHSHAHAHPDTHHQHDHPEEIPLLRSRHAHSHRHDSLEHTHAHTPDLHHRHTHDKDE